MKVHKDLPILGRQLTKLNAPLYKELDILQTGNCLEVEIDDLNYANKGITGRPTRVDLAKEVGKALSYFNRIHKDKKHFLYRTMSENSVGIWRDK